MIGGACNRPEPNPNEPLTLTVGLSAEVDSWNPYSSNEATAASVLEMLYPRLVREWGEGESNARFTPWLAERWEFSPDRLNLTFFLRTDARWTDGSTVTCRDVQFTYEAQTDEGLAWSGAFLKESIRAVDCPDDGTVVFHFDRAYPDQLLDANDDAIIPAVYGEVPFERWSATIWEDRFVGCGPFRLAEVRQGQEAILERNPSWWGADTVVPERIVLRLYQDTSTMVQRLFDGEVDMLPKLSAMRAAEAEARSDIRLIELPSLAFTYIGWNVLAPAAYATDRRSRGCDAESACAESAADILRLQRDDPHPVLADPRVRKALSLAIDREDIVQGVWDGKARAGIGPVVSAQWAHRRNETPTFDLQRSRTLLESAGWTDTDGDGYRERDGQPLEIRVIVRAENRVRRDALTRIIGSTRAVGGRLIEEALPRAEFVQRARAKEFDAVISGWFAGTRIELQNMLHTRAALNRGNNLTAWSTPVSDDLLDRAAAVASHDEALPLLHAWQRLYDEESPLAVLYEERTLIGVRSRIAGPVPSYLDPFRNLYQWQVASENRTAD